jgi:hypothetical protein
MTVGTGEGPASKDPEPRLAALAGGRRGGRLHVGVTALRPRPGRQALHLDLDPPAARGSPAGRRNSVPQGTARVDRGVPRTGPSPRSCAASRTIDGRPCASPLNGRASTPAGVWAREVAVESTAAVVTVVLRRRHLVWPSPALRLPPATTPGRRRTWRHLDRGIWRPEVRAPVVRLRWPTHGVEPRGPVRPGRGPLRPGRRGPGRLPATTADETSVGRTITGVTGERLDPARLDHLFRVGVDELSWREQARFSTLVSQGRRRCIVWGGGRCERPSNASSPSSGPSARRRSVRSRWTAPPTAPGP